MVRSSQSGWVTLGDPELIKVAQTSTLCKCKAIQPLISSKFSATLYLKALHSPLWMGSVERMDPGEANHQAFTHETTVCVPYEAKNQLNVHNVFKLCNIITHNYQERSGTVAGTLLLSYTVGYDVLVMFIFGSHWQSTNEGGKKMCWTGKFGL